MRASCAPSETRSRRGVSAGIQRYEIRGRDCMSPGRTPLQTAWLALGRSFALSHPYAFLRDKRSLFSLVLTKCLLVWNNSQRWQQWCFQQFKLFGSSQLSFINACLQLPALVLLWLYAILKRTAKKREYHFYICAYMFEEGRLLVGQS